MNNQYGILIGTLFALLIFSIALNVQMMSDINTLTFELEQQLDVESFECNEGNTYE